MIDSTKGDALADPRFAQAEEVHDVKDRLTECGVQFELAQPVGADAAEELLKAMKNDDAQLLVVGIRHRRPVGKLRSAALRSRSCWNAPSRC